MPELPEVETTVAGLRPFLEGRRIALVETRRADLRRPFPVDLAQRMTGSIVTSLSRRAKYGLIATDRDDVMIFHLGMSGRWRIDPQDDDRHDHLILTTDTGTRLALNDPRRFGSVDLVAGYNGFPEDGSYTPFLTMGPEPLSDDFSVTSLHARLQGKGTAIKLALLDQRVVAGLGNIYVCEALHMAGITPRTPAGKISKSRLGALVPAIKQVLIAAIAAGGSTLRDFARPDGELGYFAKDWLVYGREGEPCKTCDGIITRQTDGGRSTFFCAKCQR